MTTRTLATPIVVSLVLALAIQPALAIITFDQLDEDVFVVSHRIKVIGSRGKAIKVVYEKVASLCIAAGYTHYEIVDQSSEAAQEHETANASVTARFHRGPGEKRMDCRTKANDEYIQQAAAKLEKRGYDGPDPDAEAAAAEPDAEVAATTCTVEQIATMVQAGLSTAQVQAACEKE